MPPEIVLSGMSNAPLIRKVSKTVFLNVYGKQNLFTSVKEGEWGDTFLKKNHRKAPLPRGQRYIGKKLLNADKLALVKLSAKLSISKN